MLLWVLLSHSDAIGPFPTEADAEAHARRYRLAAYRVAPLFEAVGEPAPV